MQTLESIISHYYHINHAINSDKNVGCLKAFDITKLSEFENFVPMTDIDLPYKDFLRESVYSWTKLLLNNIRILMVFDKAGMSDKPDERIESICQDINKVISQYYKEISR